MAIIFTEGFDHYTYGTGSASTSEGMLNLGNRYTATQTALNDSGYLRFIEGLNGGYSLQSGTTVNVNNCITYNFPSPLTTLCFGLSHSSVTGTGCIVRLHNVAGSFIQFRLISNLPSVVTSSNTYSADPMYTIVKQWNYYEIKVTVLGSTANVQCWVNEVEVLNLSGISWQTSGNQSIERFTLGKITGDTVSVGLQYYDHVYVTTGEQLGQIEINLLRPSADTEYKQWTRSTPSTNTDNFIRVGEDTLLTTGLNGQPRIANDYVEATLMGQKDFYEIGSLGTMYNDYEVLAITPMLFANRPSGSDPVVPLLSDGEDQYNDLESFLPTAGTAGILKKYNPVETNPFTMSSWTKADIDSLRIGIEHNPIPDVPADPFWSDVMMLANFDSVTSTTTSMIHDALQKTTASYANGVNVDTTNAQSGFGRVVRNNNNNVNQFCDIVPNGVTSTIQDWAYQDEFTVEFWFRPTSYVAAGRGLLAIKTSDNSFDPATIQWMISDYNDARGLTLEISIGGSLRAISLTNRASVALPINTWHYVAFSRDIDGYIRWFINGNMVGKIGPHLGALPAVGGLRLFQRNGIDGNTTNSHTAGAFDEIRFTAKCRYNSDSPIAVPTAPFPRP